MGTCSGKPNEPDDEQEPVERVSPKPATAAVEDCKPPEPPSNPVPLDSTEASAGVEENIRRQLLAKAKEKGLRARDNVMGDSIDLHEDFSIKDFTPPVHQKSKADQELIRGTLLSSFLFKNLPPKRLEGVINCMAKEEMKAGTLLIREGDPGDKFYIAVAGEFEVVINTLQDGVFDLASGKAVKVLGAGSNFGELALMYNCPRSCSIRTKTHAVVFSLDRRSFKRYIVQANETQRDVQVATLKSVKLFEELSDSILQKISDALVRETFQAGSAIIKEGDEGNVFYILEDGEVDISTAKMGFIRTLGPGSTFGEVALLESTPRTATCMAKTKCTLMAMDRESFERLFGSLKSLQDSLKATHIKRLHTQETKEPDLPHKLVPISDLEVIKDVGRGAFGRVKIVRHKHTGDIFALKVMQKAIIVKTKNALQVIREKQLLAKVQPHPLVVQLESAMQDDNCLYLLQEFINGGDLFHRLYNIEGCFQSSVAQYYACCVTLMLEKLHSVDVVYRDLKPENLLLTCDGVLKLVDFGMAKQVRGRTYTLCGTPEYMAPEMIHSMGHSKGVDYWALGVLIYEMICGSNPFEDPSNNHAHVYRNIDQGQIVFPKWLRDKTGKQIIRQLLVRNQAKRLGCGKNGPEDIKEHPWFTDTDFQAVHDLKVMPPIQPTLADPLDISNFYPIEKDDSIICYTNLGLDHDKMWDTEFPLAF